MSKSWKLATTQAGKLEGENWLLYKQKGWKVETGYYTSRKAGRWNWLLHKQEVSGCLVSGYLELLL